MSMTQRRLLPSTAALAAFDCVARLGSFSAAADELSLTQGAISRQIAILEEQLGVRLFHRNGRGVVLTETGKTYAEGVAEVVRKIRLLSLEAMSNSAGNRLSLAILPTFGTRWLMPRIPDFVAKNPKIIINFATRIRRFDFDAEEIDAAIHIGQPDWPGADCQFLMHEDVIPVASPDFLARNPVVRPEDMINLPRVEMASRPGAWEHWFGSLGVDIKSSGGMRFEQFSNVAQACIAGLGVALMPVFLIEAELASGQLVTAYDHRVRSQSAYYLVRPLAKVSYPPVKAFSDWLIGQVRTFEAERQH
ncbi:LysR family transcriptional regulator [Rhizobium sp. TRM95796]|uniref:LysR family transcriptional regulator n=1 Tax=Rhizobium sp. TRM95796 TaxID=2979862 RepID=UPI0021E6F111|nr:LysR family transcriptional regulator [Rhizobium sp. TRM95796]MCV3767066.1 LysR family transcriptional regulator [Rhizobium sp. TRM95796]